MELNHDGLSLWYGTADAPAPAERDCARARALARPPLAPKLTIGVRPPSTANVVSVRYREAGGMAKSIPAIEVRTDYVTQAQYFLATFPLLPAGTLVEYAPVLSCAGRRVGAGLDGNGQQSWSSFQLADTGSAPAPELSDGGSGGSGGPAFAFDLDYVTRLTARLDRPETIGAVPEGLRVNYYVTGGRARGPRLNGQLRPRGGDNMIITTDGVGNVAVNCVVETDDGALVGTHFTGVADFGRDGYARALVGVLPPRPPVQIALRFVTAHPRYLWMNRLQFLGVGQVSTADLVVDYDVFAVRAGGRDSRTEGSRA